MNQISKYIFYISLICFLSATSFNSTYQAKEIKNTELEMEYVDVCNKNNDCKKFSRIIMGTDHLLQSGWTSKDQKSLSNKEFNELLDEAVRLGINIFDTSPIYVGDVENNLGKWLQSRKDQVIKSNFYYNKKFNPDKNLYTISKGGFPFDLYNSKKLSFGTHSKELLDSLIKNNILDKNFMPSKTEYTKLENIPSGTYASRLYGDKKQITFRLEEEINNILSNINPITILLMHRDDSDYINFKEIKRKQTPVKTILESLADSKIKDKYWMMGISNWKTERVNESLSLSKKYTNLPKPVLNSPYFSLFEMTNRSIHAGGVQVTHKDMMDINFQKGIKIMPYSPLGGFSILDKPEPRWENAQKEAKIKYDNGDPYWQNVYNAIFTKENRERYYRVVDFTKKFNEKYNTNYTIDQMINAYALAHVRTDFLTIGAINIEQLRRSIGAIKLSRFLTKKNLEYLYSGKK